MNYWPMNAICSHFFTQCKHWKFISENHNILFIARKYRIHTFFSLAVRNEKWRIDQREKINVARYNSIARERFYFSQTVGRSNLRSKKETDFKSVALTTRPRLLTLLVPQLPKGKISCRKSPTKCLKYIIGALNNDCSLCFSAAGGENRNFLYKYKVEEEDCICSSKNKYAYLDSYDC